MFGGKVRFGRNTQVNVTPISPTSPRPPSNNPFKKIFKRDNDTLANNLSALDISDPTFLPNSGQHVMPIDLRKLRELLRQRYALDLEIWSLKEVGYHNRKLVEAKMERADALMVRIRAIVASMDRREYFRSEGDYAKFKDVKTRVDETGKRVWMRNKPWDEEVVYGEGRR